MTAGPSLHIARDSTGVDIDAARRAAGDFLAADFFDFLDFLAAIDESSNLLSGS